MKRRKRKVDPTRVRRGHQQIGRSATFGDRRTKRQRTRDSQKRSAMED